MKNRIKPIDISIVSSYMGRFLTAIVAALVFAITIHAYATRGSDLAHVEFAIGMTAPEGFAEPLRELVAASTSRRVGLAAGEDKWDATCELFILPLCDFLELRGKMHLHGLFSLGAAPNDRAVVIARGAETADPSRLRSADILFAGPDAPNGYWAQLMALSRAGAPLPDGSAGLRFTPDNGGGERVVYSVVDGVTRYGACRASDVSRLVDRGQIAAGEVSVALDTPALPEFVVAAPEAKVAYFARKLGGLGALIDDPGESGWRDTVELLHERGIGSFRPISRTQMTELDAVAAFISSRSRGSAGKWDN